MVAFLNNDTHSLSSCERGLGTDKKKMWPNRGSYSPIKVPSTSVGRFADCSWHRIDVIKRRSQPPPILPSFFLTLELTFKLILLVPWGPGPGP